MSVIENALRRAQAPTTTVTAPAAQPAPVPTPAADATAPVTPSRTRSRLRTPSFATLLLIVLAAATFIILRQPGWGEGFERYFASALAPAPTVQAITPQYATPQDAATSEAQTVAAPPDATTVIGPDVDLRALLEDSIATLQNASLNLAASSSASAAQSEHRQQPSGPTHPSVRPTAHPPTVTAEHTRSVVALEPAVSPASRYRLGGIMLSGKTRLAIINDAIVAEGQRIDDAIVRLVGQRSVTLEIAGKSYHLPLRGAAP